MPQVLVKMVFCLSRVSLHAHSVERGALSERQGIRIRNIGREVHKSTLDVRVETGSRVQESTMRTPAVYCSDC